MKRKRFRKTQTFYYGPIGEAKSWQQQPPPPVPAPRKAPDKNVGTIEGDVGVPILQAFIVAAPWSLFIMMLTIMVIMVFKLEWWIAPLVLVTAWALLAGKFAGRNVDKRQDLWQQEITLQRDLDGDGIIGPPPEKPTLDVWIHEDNGHGTQSRPFDFGLEQELAAAFCQQVLRDGDLTEGTWGKTWLNGQRVFASINEYRQLRNSMEQAGLVAPKNPHAKSQGYDLTKAGRAVFNRTVEASPDGRG